MACPPARGIPWPVHTLLAAVTLPSASLGKDQPLPAARPKYRAVSASFSSIPYLLSKVITLKARLDGALSNLVWWKMSLLMAGGLEPDDL